MIKRISICMLFVGFFVCSCSTDDVNESDVPDNDVEDVSPLQEFAGTYTLTSIVPGAPIDANLDGTFDLSNFRDLVPCESNIVLELGSGNSGLFYEFNTVSFDQSSDGGISEAEEMECFTFNVFGTVSSSSNPNSGELFFNGDPASPNITASGIISVSSTDGDFTTSIVNDNIVIGVVQLLKTSDNATPVQVVMTYERM